MAVSIPGNVSGSASSSTGAIGGDSFSQKFGGLNINSSPWYLWALLIGVVVAVAFIGYRVFV